MLRRRERAAGGWRRGGEDTANARFRDRSYTPEFIRRTGRRYMRRARCFHDCMRGVSGGDAGFGSSTGGIGRMGIPKMGITQNES